MPKAEYIRNMFDDISGKYDLLNDVLSFGTHRLWKRKLISKVIQTDPKKVLDCATGTGDIAFLLENRNVTDIVGIDFSPEMIVRAKERAIKNASLVHFEVQDVTATSFGNEEFDAATISFGIRNVENLPQALRELSRVSKTLYVLEFGKPKSKWFSQVYFNILKLYFPLLSFVSGRSDAYDYLISSSRGFPSREEFIDVIKNNTDYRVFKFTPLFGGIAYIYEARK